MSFTAGFLLTADDVLHDKTEKISQLMLLTALVPY
jgi:hypothetical protein